MINNCRFCGIEVLKGKFCNEKCKANWQNAIRAPSKKGIPVVCRCCEVIFVSQTARFTKVCPVCDKQDWAKITITLDKEYKSALMRAIKHKKTTRMKVDKYLKLQLKEYIRRCWGG